MCSNRDKNQSLSSNVAVAYFARPNELLDDEVEFFWLHW